MVFKIVMLNVRSLFPNIDKVHHFFKTYDIICLCETWLTNGHTDNMIQIPDYDFIRLDRACGNIPNASNRPKRGGGLIIYFRKSISQYISIVPSISIISRDLEQLWILYERPNHRTEVISVIYRPPSGTILNFFDEIRKSVDHIQSMKPNAELTILGDINIDYRLRHSPEYKKVKDLEREYQLKQLISTPTRITPRNSSIIDMIFSDMEYISSSGTLDIAISDHLPIFVEKKKVNYPKNVSFTKGRSYKNYEKEMFQTLICNDMNWTVFWNPGNDANVLWDIMFNIILTAADRMCPFVKMKINNNNPEWFTQEILEEIYLKKELFQKFKESYSSDDWIAFKEQNKLVKLLIKSGKEEFVKETLDETSGNPRKFWRTINNTTGLGKNKAKDISIEIRTTDGETLKDFDAAEHINNYYINIGPSLATKFPNTWQLDDNIRHNESFSFENTNEYEILKLVKDIKLSKSSAYCEISTRLFKDAFEVLTPELVHLYNMCIQAGTFPTLWGYAEVSPIPKT